MIEHGGYGGPDCKINITQRINHDGEVNRYYFRVDFVVLDICHAIQTLLQRELLWALFIFLTVPSILLPQLLMESVILI